MYWMLAETRRYRGQWVLIENALLTEEIINLPGFIDVYLYHGPGLGQLEVALFVALSNEKLLELVVGVGHKPH